MTARVYRFGEFRLDAARRELWRGEEEQALPLSAFKCIECLIENRERAVGREELIEAVWGTAHLSDGVVAQAILTARRALGDTGKEQQFIETVRGFGYRWGVPVDVVEVASESATGVAKPSRRLPWLLAIVGVGAALGGVLYQWQSARTNDVVPATSQARDGDLALLLPVTVDAEEHYAWMRLGLMDSMAQRLRAAEQPMVPSDTVVAISRNLPDEPSVEEIEASTASARVGLVLGAHAEAVGPRWRVALRTLSGRQPPLSALAEADDALEAARLAADRMALYLGLTPAPAPDVEPGHQTLLQRVEAARLAQRPDVVKRLIEEASPELRRHPEVRFQLARLDFHSYRLDAARAAFESLLEDAEARRDGSFRARVLNSLAGIHGMRGDVETAARMLDEAAGLLQGRDATAALGNVRLNLGNVALERDEAAIAREQLARARRIYEGTGDMRRLAYVDLAMGALEAQEERHFEALRCYEEAIQRQTVVQDLGGELRVRANMIDAYLHLLDPQAASAMRPRVRELMAQATSAERVLHAKINEVSLLEAIGRRRAAAELLTEVLDTAETRAVPPTHGSAARLLLAEHLEREGELAEAVRLASGVVAELEGRVGMREQRARAWYLSVRGNLALGRAAAAAEAVVEMTRWAEHSRALSSEVYTALARAETAVSEGRAGEAEDAFETALALVDASRVPLLLLHVVRRYASWLLEERSAAPSEPQRALSVADRIAGYADRHYEAALLQLRVYHALGPPLAWRSALDRATSLAGERRIPPELLVAPKPAPIALDSRPL